jgi:two-component SAPR family response regulator
LLCDNGEWGQAKAVAGRCLAKKEWEDAFTFSVRATLARISQQEGNEEENAAHRAKMESYDQEGQLDWRYLSKHKQEYAAKLLRQPADRGEGVKVTCFGHFQVQMPGATEEVRWRTKKTQELFAYLFHLQGQPVDKETILLQLWPDLDHESATSLLHTTLYNIRKALPGSQSENLIVYGQKKYAMNMELILSPLDKMNRLCQAMGIRDEDFIYNCRDTLRSCRGEYLGGVACNFAAAPRAYFEQKFLRLCHIAASQCMERRQWEEAVSLLDMAIEADPYEESLYDLILRCFHEMKDVKRIKLYYTRLRDLLREELGVEPSDEVAAAYRLCLYNGADRQNVVGTSA